MGGGAIKDPVTKQPITGRLSRPEYNAIKLFVVSELRRIGFTAETVLELPGKLNFGDLDVLYVRQSALGEMRKIVPTLFFMEQPWHITSNGHVLSMAAPFKKLLSAAIAFDQNAFDKDVAESEKDDTPMPNYFQLDFIGCASEGHLLSSRFYFSYSDVGSIIGRLTNFYSLKFGDEGLWCDVLEHTVQPESEFDIRHTIGKLILSDDPVAICEYLNLDYDFWLNGIPQLPPRVHGPIFDWLMSSRLATQEIFVSLNSDHRARFSKRPFYRAFVEHIGIMEVEKAGNTEESESGGARFNKQSEAVDHFGKRSELLALWERVQFLRQRQEKFRGSDLLYALQQSAVGGSLEGKYAGEAISNFKSFCVAHGGEAEADEALPGQAVKKPNLDKKFEGFLDSKSRAEVLEFVDRFVAGEIRRTAV